MNIFEKILSKDLPVIFREAVRFLSWLKVIFLPLQFLIDQSILFFIQVKNILRYNGQVIYLEKALNDEFDPISRRIYIDDSEATNANPIIIYRQPEEKNTIIIYRNLETYIKNEAMYRRNEIEKFDFTVFVPNDILAQSQVRITALVNYYRIAGKIFNLKSII